MHGQLGTESRVVMQMGQQQMEASEIVTRIEPANLEQIPQDAVVYYERELMASGMWSAARERLIATGPATTRWESVNEYEFSNVMMRLMAPFIRGAFIKQSRLHMLEFQAFAEQGTDVRENHKFLSVSLVTNSKRGDGKLTVAPLV